MKNNKNIVIAFILIQIIFGLFSCTETPTENEYQPPTIGAQEYPCPYRDPTVSFDGSKIVFYRAKVTKINRSGYRNEYDSDSTGFWLCNIDGSDMKIVYRNSSDIISNPQFTPDMKYLIFVKNAQIYKAKYSGDIIKEEDIEQLTLEGRNFFPTISPDGNWIAFDNTICGDINEPPPPNSCGVLIANIEGEEKRILSKYARMPDWHQSEQKIIFLKRAFQGITAIGDSLWEYDIQSNKQKLITLLTGVNYDNRYPKFSSDGLKIVVTSKSNGGYQQAVLLDLNSKTTKRLTTGGIKSNCSWTVEDKIVYINYAPYNYDKNNGTIWIMNSDGSNKKQITFNHGLILE